MKQLSSISLGVLLISTVYCGGADAPTAVVDPNVVATYYLAQYNGAAMPAHVAVPPVDIQSGALTLYVNGTFRESLVFPVLIGHGGSGQSHSVGGGDLHTGTWTRLADGRIALSYNDVRPFVPDTAATTNSVLTKHTGAFWWLPHDAVLSYRQ